MKERVFRTLGEEGLEVHYRKGFKVIEVDVEKAEFRGIKVKNLGGFGRRKFENLVVIEANHSERIPIKVLYNG